MGEAERGWRVDRECGRRGEPTQADNGKHAQVGTREWDEETAYIAAPVSLPVALIPFSI